MDEVAVTIQVPSLKRARDFLLPLDTPQFILVNVLVGALGINLSDGVRWSLNRIFKEKTHGQKIQIPAQRTLRDAGVQFGQFLSLEFEEVTSKLSLACFQGPDFDIINTETVIGCGRNLGVDLSGLPNQEYVSGRHAKITRKNEGFVLIDLGSTNGTMLNDVVIKPESEKLLRDGDKILLGATDEMGIKFRVRLRE